MVPVKSVVSRIHERIANKRLDFIHKLGRDLVNRFSPIIFEDLTVPKMLKNHCLAKSIGDVSWGMFIRATRNKAEWAGSKVVLVNPLLDKDLNAPINIMRLRLQSLDLSQEQVLEAHTLQGGSSHNRNRNNHNTRGIYSALFPIVKRMYPSLFSS